MITCAIAFALAARSTTPAQQRIRDEAEAFYSAYAMKPKRFNCTTVPKGGIRRKDGTFSRLGKATVPIGGVYEVYYNDCNTHARGRCA